MLGRHGFAPPHVKSQVKGRSLSFYAPGAAPKFLVCRRCDRGQTYCNENCANDARRQNQCEVGQRMLRISAVVVTKLSMRSAYTSA
jgi:hypothetical protein